MSLQDAFQICLKGHRITTLYYRDPTARRDFCEQCGAATIYTCPNCTAEIKGHLFTPGYAVLVLEDLPNHCHACGRSYPWANRRRKIGTFLKSSGSKLRPYALFGGGVVGLVITLSVGVFNILPWAFAGGAAVVFLGVIVNEIRRRAK